MSSDDLRAPDEGLEQQAERLREMLSGIVEPGIRKRLLRDRVTACGRWLASMLLDEHSRANYCKQLNRMVKGELSAGQILEAFSDTYAGMLDGRVGEEGKYFFGAIRLMEADVAWDGVAAEIRAGDGPPGYPVDYDEAG